MISFDVRKSGWQKHVYQNINLRVGNRYMTFKTNLRSRKDNKGYASGTGNAWHSLGQQSSGFYFTENVMEKRFFLFQI